MRVVFPALFDAFDCDDAHCPCRRAIAAAPAPSARSWEPGRFPFRAAERAALRGAARLAADQPPAVDAVDYPGGYPVQAIGTPLGAEIHFATLCPSVRYAMAENVDAVDLARAEGGWRHPLQVFVPDDRLKAVRLDRDRALPFRAFAAVRERLLDAVADPTLPPFARMARLANLVDRLVQEGQAPATVGGGLPPLAPRDFLAFRAHVEARIGAADPRALAKEVAAGWPLLPDLELDADQIEALPDALRGDWRDQLTRWLAPAEEWVAPGVETYLAVRVFAIPLDRDQTVERGYAELFESFAQAVRLVVALAEVKRAPVAVWQLIACWALCEAHVADGAKGVAAFARPADAHARAPHLAELDLTLGGLA